ncbi:MAG: DinB family protein [Pirellulales bacterium]
MIKTLSELARQVRESTLQLLHVPEPAWLIWTPPGTANHILWHAGHALWVQDALCVEPLTGQSELPSGWAESFGQNSLPTSVTSNLPEETQVRELLEAQLVRILDLLIEYADTIVVNADEQLPGSGWPLLAGMIHGWHDEARHQGEMYLLHKLCRVGSGQ